MSNFICPVCKQPLDIFDKTYKCNNNHCFDISKQGYVNLLCKNVGGDHGDNKLMVKARAAFLSAGYYKPLLDELCRTVSKYAPANSLVLDCGCGEGWYTDGLYTNCKEITVIGFDISKEAVALAAKRNNNIEYAVASVYKIPVLKNHCDVITSVFAPVCEPEFSRILKSQSAAIVVTPGKRHLWQLKSKVYDVAYENDEILCLQNEFETEETISVSYDILLENNQDILNLFAMTPYYYKTSQANKDRLLSLSQLRTQLEFEISVYKNKKKPD